MATEPKQKENVQDRAPTLWQTISSVGAAFFGVQNSKNRERDFSQGKPSHFILMGLVMTGVFIFTIIMLVKLALKSAGM